LQNVFNVLWYWAKGKKDAPATYVSKKELGHKLKGFDA
jgi:hypothetical protein